MTEQHRRVGGVDSHKDTIHAAVIDEVGHHVADREFPTTQTGYRRAVGWLIEHGPLTAVGIEGTSSYGVGISAAIASAGIRVVEVNRTRPAERRRQGKTDRLDAYRAARSVQSGEATTDPKNASIEPLRALNVTRRSAVKAQQIALRQIGAVLINAPAHLRDRYRELSDAKLIAALAAVRPEQHTDPGIADTLHSLRSLARRHHTLGEEIADIEARMKARATAANPVIGAQLLITAGDNPARLRSSASFAALCGTAPIPVSSGRTDRHRLSRGGDRQANAALHHIVKVRLSYDPATRAYRDSRLAKGWTIKAVFRALKRAVAREIFQALAGHSVVPDYSDLRRPAGEEPHPHCSRPAPWRLAVTDRRTRTRTTTQRRTRHPLPRLAQRRLTRNRSISPPRGLWNLGRLMDVAEPGMADRIADAYVAELEARHNPLGATEQDRQTRHLNAKPVIEDVLAMLSGDQPRLPDNGGLTGSSAGLVVNPEEFEAALEASPILFDCALSTLTELTTFDSIDIATALHRRLWRDVIATMDSSAVQRTTVHALDVSRLPAKLTAKQTRILAALAANVPTEEICARFDISGRTLESHIAQIGRKLRSPGRRGIRTALHTLNAIIAIPVITIGATLADGLISLQDTLQ